MLPSTMLVLAVCLYFFSYAKHVVVVVHSTISNPWNMPSPQPSLSLAVPKK